MVAIIGAGGGAKTVTGITVGTAGGNRGVVAGYVGAAGGNKVFYSASFVAVAYSAGWYVIDYVPEKPGVDGYYGEVAVTPMGGVAPYSYAWSVVSGEAYIAEPAAAASGLASATGAGAGLQCQVTDAIGAVGLSNVVYL